MAAATLKQRTRVYGNSNAMGVRDTAAYSSMGVLHVSVHTQTFMCAHPVSALQIGTYSYPLSESCVLKLTSCKSLHVSAEG